MMKLLKWVGLFFAAGCLSASGAGAASLFKGREIHLGNTANRVVRIGVTGTTSGHNFIALMKNARQESISLGKLGYWEKVPDPPSFLRNFDLQVTVRNRAPDHFQIELVYDPAAKDIRYRVFEGAIAVRIDQAGYYPALVIEGTASPAAAEPATPAVTKNLKQTLFFDFNSFDSDLRRHYGKVKNALGNPGFAAFFYCYESTGYKKYFFRTYRDTSRLDTEKMGLSLEDGTLGYYQRVLDNLKALHGAELTGRVILVTRFGKQYAPALEQYARDTGIGRDATVDVWSYEDVR